MAEEVGRITREYAMAKADDLRKIATSMDGHRDYPTDNGDGPGSLAQRIRQAAFVLDILGCLDADHTQ